MQSIDDIIPVKDATIITKDQEETIEQAGIRIEAIPVWKWLAE